MGLNGLLFEKAGLADYIRRNMQRTSETALADAAVYVTFGTV